MPKFRVCLAKSMFLVEDNFAKKAPKEPYPYATFREKKWPTASRFHCLLGFGVVYGQEVGKIDFLRPGFIVL